MARRPSWGLIVGVPGTWRPILAWVGVALAGLIALAEIDRLIAAASSADGRSWSVAQVVGPAACSFHEAWTAWTRSSSTTPALAGWIGLHTAFDLLFVLGYGVLLLRLIRLLEGSEEPTTPGSAAPVAPALVEPTAPKPGRRKRIWAQAARVRKFLADHGLRLVVGALVAVEGVEALLLISAAAGLTTGVPELLRAVIAIVAVVKWALVVLFAVVCIAAPGPRHMLAVRLRRVGLAVKYQRLGALALGLLALLSLVPDPNLSDQLPDVQRRWLDDTTGFLPFLESQGFRHLAWATVATLAFTGVTFVVGRIRSERAHAYYEGEPLVINRAVDLWWVLVPSLVLLGALALWLWGTDGLVDWSNVWVFAVPPLVLAGPPLLWSEVRRILRERNNIDENTKRNGNTKPTPAEHRVELPDATAVAVAGDVLAVAALTVGGLSLVRSFTAPLVLDPGQPYAWALIVLAALTIVIAPLAVPWILDALTVGPLMRILDPRSQKAKSPVALRRAALVAGVVFAGVVFAVYGLNPAGAGRMAGVTATAGLLLAAWVVLLGAAQVSTQYSQPLPVFRLLGLKATPVISLLVLIGVVNALGGGDPDLHRVAGTDPLAIPGRHPIVTTVERQTVRDRFTDWLDDGRGCAHQVRTGAGQVSVRPLLLVAARGGGGRAAYWTAHGLAALGGPGTCADHAVLLSSGVSGGSVGLALAHVVGPDAGPDGLRTAVDDLTSPDALAAATAGLFDADVIGNLTGVRLPSSGTPAHPGWAWRDRARLMEETWEGTVGDLGAKFDGAVQGRAGSLVLNSTDAPSGCRVLVSQIYIGGHGRFDAPLPCGDAAVAASSDYLDGPQCPRVPSWSTAAMLSARFPFVTPAGRTTYCGTDDDGLQLVDGGYAETSGLGTLSDLAPTVMELIRAENARVAVAGGPFVVPIVVDLANGFGADLEPTAPGLAVEPLVPAVGALAGGRQGTDTAAWSTRLTTQLADSCPASSAACATSTVELRRQTGTVASLFPITEPSVTAPLGWTLSGFSRIGLQENLRCPDGSTETCGRVQALRAFLDRPPTPR